MDIYVTYHLKGNMAPHGRIITTIKRQWRWTKGHLTQLKSELSNMVQVKGYDITILDVRPLEED